MNDTEEEPIGVDTTRAVIPDPNHEHIELDKHPHKHLQDRQNHAYHLSHWKGCLLNAFADFQPIKDTQ